MKKIFLILFSLFTIPLFAHRYYVKNGGNDGLTGLSDGQAWATISKVNGFAFAAGDTVSFKCGSAWREALVVPRSGTAMTYMVFNNYGVGDNPQILGSEVISSWTNYSGNVWYGGPVADPSPEGQPFIIENDGSVTKTNAESGSLGAVDAVGDWIWQSNNVYAYFTSDPNTSIDHMEVSERAYNIDLSSRDYIEINGIDLFFPSWYNIREDEDTGMPAANMIGLTVRNCEIAYSGVWDYSGYGVLSNHSNTLIENNVIHDNGRENVSFYCKVPNEVLDSLIVQHNEFYNVGHNLIGGISANDATTTVQNAWYRNNYVWMSDTGYIYTENALCGIALATTANGGKVRDIKIYNNIFAYIQGSYLCFQHGGGVTTTISNIWITNNTFYGVDWQSYTSNAPMWGFDSYEDSIYVYNNISYNNTPDAPYYMYNADVLSSYVDAWNYNLWYRTVSGFFTPFIAVGANYYYTTNFAAYKAATGWDANAPNPADPLLINVTWPLEADSAMINIASVAKDAGIGLGYLTTYDYRDSIRDENPDIGAIEYGGSSWVPPPLPTVVTYDPYFIYTRLGVARGSCTDQGGAGTVSEKGICWSLSANPDTSDNIIEFSAGGEGAYSVFMVNLVPNTTYHTRAYAINETGIAYGDDRTFTTQSYTYPRETGRIVRHFGNLVIIR